MLYSMTGFGRSQIDTDTISVSAEIKTLNSKGLDIFCRLPRAFSHREIDIRNQLSTALERGKVELNISVTQKSIGQAPVRINRPLLDVYLAELRGAYTTENDVELFKIALTWPNILETDAPSTEAAEADFLALEQATRLAMEACLAFRKREGEVLAEIFTGSITAIETGLQAVEALDNQRIDVVKNRLKTALNEVLGQDGYDKNRFEQELIYYLEKYDITEEKVRLRTHLNYFMESLGSTNGKKIGFMAQEIGREINTIGSKANDAAIQRIVIGMKDELEKIKEQAANVL